MNTATYNKPPTRMSCQGNSKTDIYTLIMLRSVNEKTEEVFCQVFLSIRWLINFSAALRYRSQLASLAKSPMQSLTSRNVLSRCHLFGQVSVSCLVNTYITLALYSQLFCQAGSLIFNYHSGLIIMLFVLTRLVASCPCETHVHSDQAKSK